MTRRATTALTVALIGGCVGSESTAFPLVAAPAQAWVLPSLVQPVGWDCDQSACRSRPKQGVVRITGRPRTREFLSAVTPYLNCCNAWSTPYYGYAYGPALSLPYEFPAAAPAGFAIRW